MSSSTDNIGYIIPTNIVHHFLDEYSRGTYRGVPSPGFSTQDMENPAQRAFLQVSRGGEEGGARGGCKEGRKGCSCLPLPATCAGCCLLLPAVAEECCCLLLLPRPCCCCLLLQVPESRSGVVVVKVEPLSAAAGVLQKNDVVGQGIHHQFIIIIVVIIVIIIIIVVIIVIIIIIIIIINSSPSSKGVHHHHFITSSSSSSNDIQDGIPCLAAGAATEWCL